MSLIGNVIHLFPFRAAQWLPVLLPHSMVYSLNYNLNYKEYSLFLILQSHHALQELTQGYYDGKEAKVVNSLGANNFDI